MDLFNSKRLGLALVISLVAVACAAPAIPSDLSEDDEDADTSDQDITGAGKKKTPSKTTPKPKGETQPEGEGETPPGTPPPSSPPPSNPPPGTPPPGGGQCGQQDPEACFQCCDTASNGDLGKADEVFFTCACDAQCASACGNNFCNGAQPSAACETCLKNTCEPAADAACTSAACKAGMACLNSCPQ